MAIKIPFNDTSRLFVKYQDELLSSLQATAKSGHWLYGENTRIFAKQFAHYCGTEFCLPVANGTDALELALRAVLQPVSNNEINEVITVANAGGYTSAACRIVGASPVYADIEEHTQLINIDSLINCLGPNVKAIVITHLYGGAVNILKIRQELELHGYEQLPIIEDCAQAHGAKVGNNRVGSLGDISTFSFYPTKNLGACGDAGAIITSNEKLYEQVKSLHQYGWQGKYNIENSYGRNSRIDEMQAGILTTLLPYLDGHNQQRLEIWKRYRQAAKCSLAFLDYQDNDFVAHLAIAKTNKRDQFIAFMTSRNISVDIHYPILDVDQPAWINSPMRIDQKSQLIASKKSINEIVSIPCFPYMQENEVDKICQALQEWEAS